MNGDITQHGGLHLAALIWRRRGWAGMIFLLVAAFGTAAVLQVPKRYQATARLLIAAPVPKTSVAAEELLPGSSDTQSVNSALEELTSRDLAADALTAVPGDSRSRLDGDPSFWRTHLPASWFHVLGVNASKTQETVEERHARRQAVLHGMIKADRVRRTRVLTVSVTHGDPHFAAIAANAWAEAYRHRETDRVRDALASAVSFLEKRLDALSQEVVTAEAAVAEWTAETGLAEQGDSSLERRMLVRLREARISAAAEKDAAQHRLDKAREAHAISQLDRVEPLSPLAEQLTLDLIVVERELAAYKLRYGHRHPVLKQSIEARDALVDRLSREADRRVSLLAVEARAATAKHAALNAGVARVSRLLAQDRKAAAELQRLERHARAAQEIYLAQLTQAGRLRELALLVPEQVRLIDRAVAPTRASFPPKKPALAGIIGLAAVLAVLGAIWRDYLDRRVSTEEDAMALTGLDVLAAAPKDQKGELFASEIRRLGSARALRGPGVTVIVSALPSEGKTSTARAHAEALAAVGPILLVDADPDKSALSRAYGISARSGWAEADETAIVETDIPNLFVLPSGRRGFGDPQLLDRLKHRFDDIVVDTPPILAVAESLELAAMGDRVVFVLRDRITPVRAVRRALSRLATAGVSPVGLVLNAVPRPGVGGTRYGYGYGYGAREQST